MTYRAAELRAQADALEAVEELEEALIAAKEAYTEDPSPEAKLCKQETAQALREAREQVRLGRTAPVGGDAYVENGD